MATDDRSIRPQRTRSQWAAVGAALAVALGAGGVLTSSAAGTPAPSTFVPISPCRLMDTRAGSNNVGPRSTPIAGGEVYAAAVWGANGACSIPATATGVSMNVTAINPTAASFLTVFPSDAERPLAASLNWVAGQAPTPNGVNAALSAEGKVSFYNLTGTVDLTADIVGYYQTAASAPDPARVIWVAESGGDFTSVSAALASITDSSASRPYVIHVAPGAYTESGPLTLKTYVDLVGSGEDVTTLRCACIGTNGPATDAGAAVVRAVGPNLVTSVRDLTISNTSTATTGFGAALAIVGDADGTVDVHGVTVRATGGSFAYGLYLDGSSGRVDDLAAFVNLAGGGFGMAITIQGGTPVLQHVRAISRGTGGGFRYGVNLNSGAATFDDLEASATLGGFSYGISVNGSDLELHDGRVSGATGSISASGSSVRAMSSVLAGALFGAGQYTGSTGNVDINWNAVTYP